VVFPTEKVDAIAVTLWIAHTYVFSAFDTTPRLAILSAEKGSGKTRVLELVSLLANRPRFTPDISAAALYRVIDNDHPTLLIDEADAIFSGRRPNDALRGVINAGYRRGQTVMRCNTEDGSFDPTPFEVFSPIALAGIGGLPETIQDRCIVVNMRRRRVDDREVRNFRRRMVEEQTAPLRKDLARALQPLGETLASTFPTLPASLRDREADLWEPLVAIADLVGGNWPDYARMAALHLVAAKDEADTSPTVTLLGAIRTVFNELGVDRLPSQDLVRWLNKYPDVSWRDELGHDLDVARLARLMRRYDVRPTKYREGEHTYRGYQRSHLEDPWSRYLPAE